MCQPSNGIRLTAARAVLNQVATPDAMLLYIPEQRFHHIQLMIKGKDLFDTLLLCLRVCFLDHLGIVFDAAAKLLLSQDILPPVIRHQPIRVGRIARAVIIALVEGQEPAVLSGQLRAELDAGVVHGKVHHAALEGKQLLMRVAVILITQLKEERDDHLSRSKEIRRFLETLEKQPSSLSDWNEQAWSLLVSRVTVRADGSAVFLFRGVNAKMDLSHFG